MHPAGVIAEHSANCAMTVGRGIGSKNQTLFHGLLLELIEHDPRFDARELFAHIDFENPMVILGEIDDHRGVTTLTGQARASAPASYGRVKFSTSCDRGNNVVAITRDHDSDGYLPIVRAIGGIERAIAVAEPNLAANRATQLCLQSFRIHRSYRHNANFSASFLFRVSP